MLIKFKSIIETNGEKNEIAFSAPVVVSQWEDFQVFEFIEPAMKEQNRIEVAPDKVNIFSGANTLNLALGEKIAIEYLVQGGGVVYFETQLHWVNISDHEVELNYSLFNQEKVLGNYNLTLTISQN